jgi:hypothetical protein
VPSVGVLGSGFYSALNCLSLTAGASPATTSFPGVVYLRGDNGTKVVNGFYTDTITATGNSVLPTITTNALTAPTGSNLAFFAPSCNIQFNSATVGFNARIAGALSVSTLTDVATINGSAYPPASGSGVWCSTATTALNMNGFGINGVSSISGNPNLRINGLVTTSNATNWTNGSVNTLYGSEVLSSKYIQWSYDNNPGTGIYDNNSIGLFAPIINMNNNDITGVKNIYSAGNLNFYAPSGLAVGFNNTVYFNNNAVFNPGANLDMNNATIYNAHELYNNNNDLLLSGITKNILIQTFSGGSIYLNNSGANVSLNTDGSMYLQTTGTNQTVYVNTETMYFTGSSNNKISGLGHIYGNTSAPGGGLGIDYMYGLFFNGGGKNANLYCDNTALRMINFNTGTEITTYNANGTGNLSLYSQNNDVTIGSGRYIALNATTGCAMNNGGASISIASDNNIYFTGNGGSGTTRFANFQDTNVAFNSGTPGSLSMYMNGNNIRNVGDLTRNLGSAVVSQPVIQYGTASGSGVSGTVTVTIPNTYTSRATYVVQVTMKDAPTAQLYATPITGNTFTIGWTSAGTGTQNIMWVTFGT